MTGKNDDHLEINKRCVLPLLAPTSQTTNNNNADTQVKINAGDSGIENNQDSDNNSSSRNKIKKQLVSRIIRPIFRKNNQYNPPPTSFQKKNNSSTRKKNSLSRQRKPSVMYPVIIVFLEFFAWGLQKS